MTSRTFETLMAAKQNLENILDNLMEGLIAHDTERRILFFNRAAEAITGCSLIAYRRRAVEQQALTDKVVSQQLFQHAMQSLSQAQAHSLLLGRRGAAEKVAGFLLDWASRIPKGAPLHLAMSRQDIADYLGLTIETVSRSMSQFEREGTIALTGARHVNILNRNTLQALAA